MALCAAAGLKVIPTGLKHGTVTVHGGRHQYEVTTLRRDVATDGRHAVVEFTDDFVLDAARRDLTINAMSCDGQGRLFDPFDGEADLGAGRIRFVGDPATRIREDYLRILRFFRFYGRFGRPPADGASLAACRELAPGIDRLSGERVRQELLRLLETVGAVAALELMRDTGVLRRILPEPPTLAPLARLAAAWPDADSHPAPGRAPAQRRHRQDRRGADRRAAAAIDPGAGPAAGARDPAAARCPGRRAGASPCVPCARGLPGISTCCGSPLPWTAPIRPQSMPSRRSPPPGKHPPSR